MLFRITQDDDYGRAVNYLGLINANSAEQAKQLAATILKNPDITNTGYFSAREITAQRALQEYDAEITLAEKKYHSLNF